MVKRADATSFISELEDKKIAPDKAGAVDTLISAPQAAEQDDSGAAIDTGHSSLLDERSHVKRQRIYYYDLDPTRIRIRDDHDRDYTLLNEVNCADLISGFDEVGQLIPAIVRPLSEQDDYDWELLCGARRHWTATFQKKTLRVEVRDIDELDIFLLTDHENRSRKDISDYERALKYANAIGGDKLFKDAKQLAMKIGISRPMMSYLLKFAKAPAALLRVLTDLNDFTEHNYRVLHPFALTPKTNELKPQLVDALASIENQSLSKDQLSTLIKEHAVNPVAPRAQVDKFTLHDSHTGKVSVTVKNNPKKSTISIEVNKTSLTDPAPVIEHIQQALAQINEQKTTE